MSKVYICFSKDVLNVERIPIVKKEYGDIHQFDNCYIYYQEKENMETSAIQQEIKDYFRRLIKLAEDIND